MCRFMLTAGPSRENGRRWPRGRSLSASPRTPGWKQLAFLAGCSGLTRTTSFRHRPPAGRARHPSQGYPRLGGLDWEPFALICDDSVVGVLALAHASAHTELLHLVVDAGSQGQRVGSAAVALVLRHVMESRPRAEELRLTVHPDNEFAQRLYRGAGFLPGGQLRDGEPVCVLNLSRGSASGPPPDRH